MSARRRRPRRKLAPPAEAERGHLVELMLEREDLHEVTPVLAGGDMDADWARAESSGEEMVGGSEPTPDQDIVDELAHALGVEQDSDAELRTTGEILRERDRLRWRLEAEAADAAEGRGRRPRERAS